MGDSLHYTILESVQTAIQDLDLTGIANDNVVILKENKRLERQEIGIPGVGIMHSGESEIYEGPNSTNIYEEIGYPVLVIMFDLDRGTGEPSQTLSHDTRLYWRQQIVARFLGQSLTTDVCRCTIASRPVFLPAEWKERSAWVSPLLFYFWGRVARL